MKTACATRRRDGHDTSRPAESASRRARSRRAAPLGAKDSDRFSYPSDEGGKPSQRKVRPLGLHFRGQRWTLGAWCEMRTDFRSFRLDRTANVAIGDKFPDEDGKRLDDFLRAMGKK